MRHLIATLCLSLATFAVGQAWSAPTKPAAPAKPAPAPAPDQPPPKLTVAQILDRQLTNLEKEFVPAAEAMPDDKFGFAPTQGEFKDVRTFALQIKHVAHTNFLMFAMLLGEKLPANVDPKEDNGPDKMTSKADILKYLKESFAMGHRAMATLSDANLTERVAGPDGKPGPTRLGAASLTVWHSFDHYGQMVEYLRMNGIVPPASRTPQ
ncbi:MAG TPA: DinB family protein [Kofleriaceae bacterium]